MNKLLILLVLSVVVAIPIVAGQLLPWWGTLIVLMVEIPLILAYAPKVIGLLIKRHLVSMFKKKARVLAGAEVTVHSVSEVAAPADAEAPSTGENEDEESATPRRYVQVDFTVSPRVGGASSSEYAASDICLVSPDAALSPELSEAHTAFAVKTRLVAPNDEENECDQLCGPAHLRMVFAVPQGIAGRAKFLYYFERFGELQLPW